MQGVDGAVEISRDRWGMPRVRAQTAHDLWFGQGFAHGQDRLWQCELHRRVGQGRLSEFAGADGLTVDRFMRTLGLRRVAMREEAELDPELRSLLDAYCAGINAAAEARGDAAGRVPAPAPRLRALAPGRLPRRRQAARLRALDQLGARAAARRPGPRAGRGAGGPHRPDLPVGQPGRAEARGGLRGRRPGAGRADRARSASRSAWPARPAAPTTGRSAPSARRPDGPLIAGDPHLPSGMPGIWLPVALELDDRFCRGGVDPRHPGDLRGPEQRRRLDLHQRDGRRPGPVRRADRGRALRASRANGATLEIVEEQIEVKGRTRRSARRSASPTTARSSTSARRRRRRSRWPCAGPRSTPRPSAAPHFGILEPRSGRRAGRAAPRG